MEIQNSRFDDYDNQLAESFHAAAQGRYNQIYENDNFTPIDLEEIKSQLEKGKKGISTKSPTHMGMLANIVGTSAGKQDIKRINNAMTVEGARQWIKNQKLDKYYTAEEKDIDGDGISDVLVRDAAGKLVIVNGYTLKPSDYPLRKIYYGLSKEERKPFTQNGGQGYRTWVNDAYYQPQYDANGISIQGFAGKNPDEDPLTKRMVQAHFKTNIPHNRSPYQVFARVFVKPIYDSTLQRFRLLRADGKKPNIFINVLSRAWKQLIVIPILSTMLQNDKSKVVSLLNGEPKLLNRVLKGTIFKQMSADMVRDFLNSRPTEDNKIYQMIVEITKHEAALWFSQNSNIIPMQGFGAENNIPQPTESPIPVNVVSPSDDNDY